MSDSKRPYRTDESGRVSSSAEGAYRMDLDLPGALAYAEAWAEGGYSVESQAYWRGMRDTLRVLLGVTQRAPAVSTTDAAASTLLGPFGPARKGDLPMTAPARTPSVTGGSPPEPRSAIDGNDR